MKKGPIFLGLLLISLFTSAFSLQEWRESVYEQIKNETIKGLKANFRTDVQIGKTEGIVAGQVVFRDVIVPDFGRARTVTVNFNLAVLAYKRDVIPAITTILIEDGEFEVRRDRGDRLNVLRFLPAEEPGAPPPPPFRAKLVFKNCRVNYQDLAGFRKDAKPFYEKLQDIRGEVSFRKKDLISFDLAGTLGQNFFLSQFKLSGSNNLKTGKYEVNVSADRLDLAKWGNYAVPFEPLVLEEGSADIILKIANPKTKGWPVSLVGNFKFYNARGRFLDYEVEKTSGNLSLADDRVAFEDFSLSVNSIPLELNGRFYDFAEQNLELSLLMKETDLNKVVALFPQTRALDLQGRGNASLRLAGRIASPVMSGAIRVKEGKLYNQKFAGRADLSFAKNLLKIENADVAIYRGSASGSGQIDFSRAIPALSLKARLKEIDLAAVAQDSPGIVGRANGDAALSGPFTDLSGNLSAELGGGMFFGQPIDRLSASFKIREGEVLLENFRASSQNSSLASSGRISRDLTFDFQASANGIRLSGEGVLGKMEAMVNSFQGNVRWKMDEKFFAAPLKNLQASGKVSLSRGKVGEQLFDQAQGSLNLGQGLIRIEEVAFIRNKSVLQASGQTGIGTPTALKVSGEKVDLEDLKLLNYFLPPEARDPTGYADVNIEITGEISKETRITSLDPLLDLNVKGEFNLINVKMAETPVSQAALNLEWKDRNLNFSKCSLATPGSRLAFDLQHVEKGGIKGEFSGMVDFSDFKMFTAKYGDLEGQLGLNLIIQGSAQYPDMAASFWLRDFAFNNLTFDRVQGSVTYADNKLTFPTPLLLSNRGDKYQLSGVINLEAMRNDQPEESYADLKLKILQADLSSVVILLQNVQGELTRKVTGLPPGEKSKIDLSAFALPTANKYAEKGKAVLYAKDGEKGYFLKNWEDIRKEFEKATAKSPEENMGGKVTGDLSLKGKFKKPAGKFSGQVKNGFFRNYTFETIQAEASLEDEKIRIEKLELFKKGGKLQARGVIGLDGGLALDLTAQKMPLDILRLLFDEDFAGEFNMNASVEGETQNPRFSASLSGRNISLAGVEFDKASLLVTKRNSHIYIHDFSLVDDGNLSQIHGTINLASSGGIDLEARLKDDALGLFNLLTDDVKWIRGKGTASARIRGPLENLDMNGEIKVKDAVVYARVLDSQINRISGEARIKESLLDISGLTGIWQGEKTKNYPNFLGMAGTVKLNKILAENKMVHLDLNFSPSVLYADMPNLYAGVVRIGSAQLSGPLYFDLSAGPTLKGNIEIDNALITLSQRKETGKKIFPLDFDLKLALKKNVYATMGDITTLDLSNIFMNLEIASDDLKVSGSLAYPSLLGKIIVRRGTVNIFNREFSLLSPEMQEKYYSYNADKIKENVAVFTGEKGKEGLMPDVTITAKVEVENVEEDAAKELVRKRVVILSRLRGVIGAVEKERGLKVSLDSFTPDYKPAGYGEQDIKAMLLPDFIKSMTGISRGEKVDTNAVVADYLNSRLQSYVFRGIERELEQKLGLESLTLEYNFGKDIRQAMGVNERRVLEGERPDWRVGFVKGFFDKFYLDVNYAEFGTETEAVQGTFNYQLTYKLSRIWSIIYYREPISLQDLNTGYQKVTLKAGFSFW
jgi:hypothetical protein